MSTITESFAGQSATSIASVEILSIVRLDTNQSVGVVPPLPQPMTLSGTNYTFSFTDPAPFLQYVYTGQCNLQGTNYVQFTGTLDESPIPTPATPYVQQSTLCRITSDFLASGHIVVGQYSQPTVEIDLYDQNGAPVSMGTNTVRFVTFTLGTGSATAQWQLQTGGAGVVVQGSETNQCLITIPASNTAYSGNLNYEMWNIAPNVQQRVARGVLEITPGALSG